MELAAAKISVLAYYKIKWSAPLMRDLPPNEAIKLWQRECLEPYADYLLGSTKARVVWSSDPSENYHAIMVLHGGTLYVGIRGTIKRWANYFADASVALNQLPAALLHFLPSDFGNVRVMSGLVRPAIQLMIHGGLLGAFVKTVSELISAVSGQLTVCVTGHSFGGQLAAALVGPCLREAANRIMVNHSRVHVRVDTFGSPTIGCAALQRCLANLQSFHVTRHFHQLDPFSFLWLEHKFVDWPMRASARAILDTLPHGTRFHGGVQHEIDTGRVRTRPTDKQGHSMRLYHNLLVVPPLRGSRLLDHVLPQTIP